MVLALRVGVLGLWVGSAAGTSKKVLPLWWVGGSAACCGLDFNLSEAGCMSGLECGLLQYRCDCVEIWAAHSCSAVN